jgi:DNA-binding CsgD family transcriptional regulator
VRVWLQCCLYNRYLSTDFDLLTIVGNGSRVIWIAFLLALGACRLVPKEHRRLLTGLSILCMTAAPILYLLQSQMPSLPLALPAAVLAGVGIAWGGGMWIRLFARLGPVEALLCTFLCLAASSFIGFFVGILPSSVAWTLCIFLPAFSLVMYWQAAHFIDNGGGERAPSAQASPASPAPPTPPAPTQAASPRALTRLALGLALLSFVLGLARGFPHGGAIALPLGLQFAHQFGVALCSLFILWLVLIRKRPLRLANLWHLQIGLMLVGVIAVTTMLDVPRCLGATLITIANTLMVGILWYCSYDVARSLSRPPTVVLAVVWLIHLVPREVARLLLGTLDLTSAHITLLIAGMICLIALALIFVLRDYGAQNHPLFAELNAAISKRDTAPGAEETPARMTLEERRRVITRRYSLTEREADTLFLTAQGYSRGHISRELCISLNTTKGYLRTAYQKLGIHSRQELFEILDECDALPIP